MRMNCNYLAFEGIDGSGKTSFIEGLCEILDNQSKKWIQEGRPKP